MKLPCDLVRDLLPLYEDEVCSQTSREAVEEHLRSCENCRKLVENTRNLPEPEIMPEAPAEDRAVAKGLKKVRNRWRRSVAVLLLIPVLLLLGFMGFNQYRGWGVCFTNLDEIWLANRFLNALEKHDWETAADCVNYSAIYAECQEAINLRPEDFLPDLAEVSIGGETWLAQSWFAQLYLNDTENGSDLWCYLIFNRELRVPVPEEIWWQCVRQEGMEPQPAGDGGYYLTDGICFHLLETQWGNFMIFEDIWDTLQGGDIQETEYMGLFVMVPEGMYRDLEPTLEANARNEYEQIQNMHREVIGLDQQEFTDYVRQRYLEALRNLANQGIAVKNRGYRRIYYNGNGWCVTFNAQVFCAGKQARVGICLEMEQGKIHFAGMEWEGDSSAWFVELLDYLNPAAH